MMTDDCKQQLQSCTDATIDYSNFHYILIINAEKQCNSQNNTYLFLVRSCILLVNNHLWTGRQTERRQREVKTAMKSEDQMHSNWF